MDEPKTPYNIGKSPNTRDPEEPESVGSNNVISSGLEEQLSGLNINDQATPSPGIGSAGPNSVDESSFLSKLSGTKLRDSIDEWENSDESSCSSFVSTMSDVDGNLWNDIFPVAPTPPSVEDKRIEKRRLRDLKKGKGVREDSDIIKSLEKFKNDYRRTKRAYSSLEELKMDKREYEDLWQVQSMNKKEVCSKIQELYEPFNKQKERGELPCFVMESEEEVFYVEELECYVLKGRSTYRCEYDDHPKSVFVRIHCLLHLIHRLLMEDITVNIRWIQYAFRDNFVDTSRVEYVLERLCKAIGCSRDSLNIFASAKGKIAGDISMKITRGGRSYITNCQGGTSIEPRDVAEKVEFNKMMKEKLLLIVVVEKDTIFQRLVEENFHMRFRCIIITGCGMPDVATRTLFRIAQRDLDLPGVAFTDHNADGFNIYLTYLCGSEKMAYENLSTPYIKWLGLSPSDLMEHDIPIGDVKARGLATIKNKDFVMNSPELAEEVGKMETKVDAESMMKKPRHLKYWTEIYLPLKFQRLGDGRTYR